MTSENKELLACICLSHFEGIGPLRFRALKKYFGSAFAIYLASKEALVKTNLSEKLINRFVEFRNKTDLDSLFKSFQKRGIEVITEEDSSYPDVLKPLKSAPFILYTIGDKTLLKEVLTIGIVGTRKPTSYGKEITKSIAYDLASNGFTIVSGMAMGIDAVAHDGALKAQGKTIAVLGCGVDICYPAVNRSLYEEIKKKGLVISEFPPGTRTSRGVFPSRNRIVAGLSLGVLVTEGAERSGSLITARFASEFGKDVFAVPGPVTSEMSGATTLLLKEGAIPVSSSEDIVSEYKDLYTNIKREKKVTSLSSLSKQESLIVTYIQENGTVHIDKLVRITNQPMSDLLPIISTLELNNIISEIEDGEYVLSI